MRVAFKPCGDRFPDDDRLRSEFAAEAARWDMDWALHRGDRRPRMLIAVSRASHCLNDLLYRWQTGALPVEIAGVFSNHEDLRGLTERHGVAFHYFPVDDERRDAQETEILKLIEDTQSEWLVLARYMQRLSPNLAKALEGRCVNIHHSFLPGVRGARPYHQAHRRGVKLIGATAHFVTEELDEGPIIEQAVERVDHRAEVEDLIRIGRDIEAQVLARAIGWLGERRVLLNGGRTVVFR
jgi:formyltetrahydrofolate deformylase